MLKKTLVTTMATAALILAPATAASAAPYHPDLIEECEGPGMEWYGGSCERRHDLTPRTSSWLDRLIAGGFAVGGIGQVYLKR